MSLAVKSDATAKRIDLKREGGNLLGDDGLEAAVVISLFTHRQAEPSDELPDGTDNRRGWWGDAFARAPGHRKGSRLWLLARGTLGPKTAGEVKQYAEEALAWMLEDGVASAIEVTTERTRGGIRLAVSVHGPLGSASRWQGLWELRFDAI